MLFGSLGISIFMIVVTFVALTFLLRKLKYINSFNMTIYIMLGIFWVTITMFKEQLSQQASFIKGDIGLPLIISASTAIQVFFRLPIGKLSQKLRSRKIPLLMLTMIFFACAIPFLVVANTATFVLLSLAFGLFGASFGMQNQYFAENWSLRNTFSTVALMSFLPTLGVFITNVFHEGFALSNSNEQLNDLISQTEFRAFFKWALVGAIILLGLTILFYAIFHKENKQSIRLDNVVEDNKKIAQMTLIDVFRMSSVILFIGMANQLIFRKSVTMVSNSTTWNFIYILITATTLIVTIITAVILIRKFKTFTLATIAQVFTFIGITLGMIMWFGNIHSMWMGLIFIFIFGTAVAVYETTIFGTIIHFDHKNRLLVLGIWLSIRSFGYAVGDGIGGVVEDTMIKNSIDSDLNKWLVLGGFILVVIAMVLTFAFYKKNKPVYDIVDKYENTKSSLREHIWKIVAK